MATLRLTRRGKAVLTFVMMVILILVGFSIGRGSSAAVGSGHPARHTVTVQAGDTLWSLASRVEPARDPRVVVGEIESLNGLTSPIVVPGQQLAVPGG